MKIETLVEKNPSHHKKLWSIYCEVLSVTWPDSKVSNIYYHIKFRKSIMNRCPIKKLLLKISQYSQVNTCVGVYFLIKMQVFSPATLLKTESNSCFTVNIAKWPAFLLKMTPIQVFSCEYCEICKNTCFEEHLCVERFPTWTNSITSNIERKEDIFSNIK